MNDSHLPRPRCGQTTTSARAVKPVPGCAVLVLMVAATRTHLDLQKAPPAEVRLATPAATTSTAPRAGADYNLQIVWSLARYVEEHFGPDALGEVATAGGLQPSDFHRK